MIVGETPHRLEGLLFFCLFSGSAGRSENQAGGWEEKDLCSDSSCVDLGQGSFPIFHLNIKCHDGWLRATQGLLCVRRGLRMNRCLLEAAQMFSQRGRERERGREERGECAGGKGLA